MPSLLERLRAQARTATSAAPAPAPSPSPSPTGPSLLDRLKGRGGPPPIPSLSTPLLERLVATARPDESPEGRALIVNERGAIWFAGVRRTDDFRRIAALPRRNPETVIPDLTSLFRKPAGTLRLRPVQNRALYEIGRSRGLLGPIAVGGGKTLILILAPLAAGAKRAVLLVKPDLRDQLLKVDWPFYGQHFRLPENVTILSYSQLSTAKSADALDRLEPDLIVADECHALKSVDAARTKRFKRYMKAHPACRFVGLSGSMSTRSIKDFAHLSEFALRQGSPLPIPWSDLQDWALVLDPQVDGMEEAPPGALLDFCMKGESVRAGFRRRLVETPGVVASGSADEGMSLRIRALDVEVPPNVAHALAELRRSWTTPGGEEIEDAISLARSTKQLGQGFYYIWGWGAIGRDEPDEEWLNARSVWHRAVRGVLHHRSRPGLDSPLFVTRAAIAGELRPDELEAYAAWAAVKHRPKPPTLPIWIDDFLVRDVRSRIDKGVIWYEHRAVGQRIAELHGLPLFAGGDDSSKILSTKEPLIVASIRAHGTGKNLQRYAHGLVCSAPSSGATWHQLLGRMHRPGQLADEVIFDVYMHDECYRNSFENAKIEAIHQQEIRGADQKLLQASFSGLTFERR